MEEEAETAVREVGADSAEAEEKEGTAVDSAAVEDSGTMS